MGNNALLYKHLLFERALGTQYFVKRGMPVFELLSMNNFQNKD